MLIRQNAGTGSYYVKLKEFVQGTVTRAYVKSSRFPLNVGQSEESEPQMRAAPSRSAARSPRIFTLKGPFLLTFDPLKEFQALS
jgi:hypothetical protein